MDKWYYIEQIRYRSRYDNRDYLLDIMDKYKKNSIAEITCDEAREFWNGMRKGRKRL